MIELGLLTFYSQRIVFYPLSEQSKTVTLQWVGRLDNSEDQADIKPEGKIVEEMKPRERKL